jgi:hypothetical protein
MFNSGSKSWYTIYTRGKGKSEFLGTKKIQVRVFTKIPIELLFLISPQRQQKLIDDHI